MKKVLILGHPDSSLTRDIASFCKADFFPVTIDQFADTSMFTSLASTQSIDGAHVLLVHQFSYNVSTQNLSVNDQLMGVFQIIDLLKQMKARSIHVLLPNLAYARQDVSPCKQYRGFVFTLGNFLKTVGVDNLIACQLHATSIIQSFPIALHHCSLEPFWKNIIEGKILKAACDASWCVVSPDKGGYDRVKTLAALLNMPLAVIHKTRVSQDAAIGYELIGDVAGKHIILFDDIIDTGRTAISACELLLSKGAAAVYGCFSHGVFSQGTYERLESSRFQEIFVTNSVATMQAVTNQKMHVVSLNSFLSVYMAEWLTKQIK